MKSIFNASDRLQLIERINNLTPQSKALWGTMNVAQMLVHLQLINQVPLGEIKTKSGFVNTVFGPIAKFLFINDKTVL